jgi:hemerythrin superfamily protein
MDEIASQGMGKVHGVKARLSGLVGIFKTLATQHAEAGTLLKRVRTNPGKRAELWPKIRMALLTHEGGEMQVLYPELHAREATRTFAEQHDAEAAQLDTLIAKIHALDIQSEAWGRAFDTLVDTVLAHVAEEEREIFPLAQQVLGAERARALEAEYLAAQKRLEATL